MSDNEAHEAGLFTVDAFMSRYGVGRSQTYKLINDGALEAVKLGRMTRIVARSAEKWAASLPRVKPGSMAGARPGRRRAS
jgi:excisionase family DNA binding protein